MYKKLSQGKKDHVHIMPLPKGMSRNSDDNTNGTYDGILYDCFLLICKGYFLKMR